MDFRTLMQNDFKKVIAGEFSESVTVQNQGKTLSATIRAIVDDTFLTIDPSTNAQIMSTKPRATIIAADVPFVVKQGDFINMRGKTWTIKEPQPDGEGSITLYV